MNNHKAGHSTHENRILQYVKFITQIRRNKKIQQNFIHKYLSTIWDFKVVTSLLLQYAPVSIALVSSGKVGIQAKEKILVLAHLAQELVSTTDGVSVACTFVTENWTRTAILFYMVYPRYKVKTFWTMPN